MVNYSNGKIYKIEPNVGGQEGDIYIGSTTQPLSKRMVCYRSHYKQWKEGTRGKTNSYDLFDKYGINSCVITLLESVKANSKDELLAKERYYIKSLDCVNKLVAGRTKPEYYTENNEQILQKAKEYYKNNKIKKQSYCGANKEKIKEYQKQYYEDNKEKIASQQKEWRLNQKKY